jgi:preprotein translocase subunit SecA
VAWGQLEMQRVSANRLSDLDADTQAGLQRVLGAEWFTSWQGVRIADLGPDDSVAVHKYLGQRVMFNVQRQLMLDITSRYWVEHLTAMEELRQGIGLQSYAQKDPLAEYKVRAYEMFQDLLHVIQTDVVTAMFTYRPRDLSQVRVGVERKKRIAPTAQPVVVGEGATPRAGNRPPRRRKRR